MQEISTIQSNYIEWVKKIFYFFFDEIWGSSIYHHSILAIKALIKLEKSLKWLERVEGLNPIIELTLCLQTYNKGWNGMAKAMILNEVPC